MLAFCYVLSRQAVSPLRLLVRQAHNMAQADFGHQLPKTDRVDEIGQLQNAFATMQESITGYVTDLRKVKAETEQRNEELVVAKSKAEEADRKKTEFIQDLTHQIRTPLNIIGGFAQVLQNDCEMLLDEDIESISTGILQNSQDIQTIISNLLTISALEECSEIERTDEVACNAFCQEVMDSVILRYPATVSMSMETKVPDTFCIKTHRESLRMILRELLENANKFTKVGNITLHCRQQDAQWVEFSISDTGQGVLPEDYERIFTMFTKLSAFSEGLGLGLYLSRRQARLMGGDIEIDKNYTGGSRFTVRLPLS
jgi:signal transduction histidine kinase